MGPPWPVPVMITRFGYGMWVATNSTPSERTYGFREASGALTGWTEIYKEKQRKGGEQPATHLGIAAGRSSDGPGKREILLHRVSPRLSAWARLGPRAGHGSLALKNPSQEPFSRCPNYSCTCQLPRFLDGISPSANPRGLRQSTWKLLLKAR